MATVLDFPPVRRPLIPPRPRATARAMASQPQLPTTAGKRGEYAIADVARPLGMLHRPVRAIIDALRALHVHEDMPLPRTPRIVHGVPVQGARKIFKLSRWDAGEFDAWLEGRGPATPAAALPPPIRQEMAMRAAALGQTR